VEADYECEIAFVELFFINSKNDDDH